MRRSAVFRTLELILGIVFLASGVEKFIRSDQFAGALVYLVPLLKSDFAAVQIAATGVALGEIVLGVSLIVRWAPRMCAGIALAVLVVFSIILLRLLMDPDAPPCRCTAWIALSAKFAHTASFGLARNAVLLAMGAAIWHHHSRGEVRA